MADTEYTVDVKQRSEAEGGGFVAVVPELPGCNGYGATPDEAARNAIDAIVRFLAVKPAAR
ncbi:MAG TPA: type II toxin-antitoxin system HicB family antitoxin [Alphaproteobacteria bacterium]|jgi:predicted RNase H-like HicB family nuclease|nr:type II toxin-antitoxin system HicB family antitoxin [Alphaproteobacteria bacterium]